MHFLKMELIMNNIKNDSLEMKSGSKFNFLWTDVSLVLNYGK